MEIAFVERPIKDPVPSGGILAAPDFDLNLLRRAGPEGGADRPAILGGMKTRLITWPGAFCAGPVMGAPLAVMALEELARRGAREIIFVGSAGCLSDELPFGTIFCPGRGISTEGTSGHYPAPLAADEDLRGRVIRAGADLGLDARDQVIWSTDGIYRETRELVARQRAAGAGCVDMETTALFAAAAFRGVKLAAILVISDHLVENRHHTGFNHPDFKAGVKKAAALAWKVLQ